MALPASGEISLNDLKTLTGQSALSWVQANTKDAVHDMNSIHARNYYASNQNGNCNNGNCDQADCNCACDYNCYNCHNCYAVNCANCDAQAWLQADCNCNCTYNCTPVADVGYNCAACACDCNACGG